MEAVAFVLAPVDGEVKEEDVICVFMISLLTLGEPDVRVHPPLQLVTVIRVVFSSITVS